MKETENNVWIHYTTLQMIRTTWLDSGAVNATQWKAEMMSSPHRTNN